MSSTADATSCDAITPRILIVDHHDSYTHNVLISLLDALALDAAEQHGASADRSQYAARLRSRTLVLPHTSTIWQDTVAAHERLLPHFDVIILGPGPGRPDVQADFGASKAMLDNLIGHTSNGEEARAPCIPTLGLCLGHQGIAFACGGQTRRATHLRHGLASELSITEPDRPLRWPGIMHNLPVTSGRSGPMVTTYNSLIVDPHSLPSCLTVTAVAHDGPILPTDHASSTEQVIMALQHDMLPIWGVQFHPESISSEGGTQIMLNLVRNSRHYWRAMTHSEDAATSKAAKARLAAWSGSEALPNWIQNLGTRVPAFQGATPNDLGPAVELQGAPIRLSERGDPLRVIRRSLGRHDTGRARRIFDFMFRHEDDDAAIWLDSARPGGRHSRFSYMARPAWSIGYEVVAREVSITADGKERLVHVDQKPLASTRDAAEVKYGLLTPKQSQTNSPEMTATADVSEVEKAEHSNFWTWFNRLQLALQHDCDSSAADNIDFRTGFVGYFGYEMKREALHALRAPPSVVEGRHGAFPTAWFGFCDRVVVIDHETSEWFALGLIVEEANEASRQAGAGDADANDELGCVRRALTEMQTGVGCASTAFDEWLETVSGILNGDGAPSHAVPADGHLRLPLLRPVDSAATYETKVEKARALIARGETYELCLTTEFRGQLPPVAQGGPTAFELYCRLRACNPAPYSAFVRLNRQRAVLSTSPEKFLGVSHVCDTTEEGMLVEMKPIKGTIARAGHRKGEETYLRGARGGDLACVQWCSEEDARRIATLHGDAKERAENLIIVDLIRRDLLSFCAAETVVVPTLMGIETYETVHQMVSTVHGRKDAAVGAVEAVERCFPPGSMTGAPKVRSVELLQQLEEREPTRGRGVYSGVLGWVGLDGAANFNVVIRTICLDGRDVSVGAGGAITYHSNAESEWQEVLDKVGAIAKVDLT